MKFSFIIPTKDRPDVLNISLQHLMEAISGDDCEIIVVNDSKTSIPSVSFQEVKVINNPGRGVASARNYGAENAVNDLLWFLDDDIWLTKEAYLRAKQLTVNYPGSIFNFNWVYPPYLEKIVQNKPFGRYLSSIGFTTMQGWCKGMPWENNALFPTEWLAGATLLIPAAQYRKVNGYNSTFPLAGFEDYDFSVRVKEAGIAAFIDSTVLVYHNESGKISLSGFLQRTRNNSVTRRHGVSIGYTDHELRISKAKVFIYRFMKPLEPALIRFADLESLPRFMDPVLKLIYKYLVGAAIYHGYYTHIPGK